MIAAPQAPDRTLRVRLNTPCRRGESCCQYYQGIIDKRSKSAKENNLSEMLSQQTPILRGLSIQVSDFSFSFWVKQDHKALASWSVLADLSRLDSNRYKAILRFKRQIADSLDKSFDAIISQGESISIQRLNDFGEIEAVQIKQQHKVLSGQEIDAIIAE